ncbi:MAG: hypothetical protein K2O40_14795 [Lachnospiraceae bacterium]|nr:hypothetical protein [Lachnospiraceae bacterium]
MMIRPMIIVEAPVLIGEAMHLANKLDTVMPTLQIKLANIPSLMTLFKYKP